MLANKSPTITHNNPRCRRRTVASLWFFKPLLFKLSGWPVRLIFGLCCMSRFEVLSLRRPSAR
ncbi:MAG: hypothetical protein K2G84_06210, partial [Muribaculaceae bacterium]|nr:hypothetical protein [Muribaculaceae bacterium]